MSKIVELAVKRLCEIDRGGVEVIKNVIIEVVEEEQCSFTWSEFDTIFTQVCFALEDRKMLANVICR